VRGKKQIGVGSGIRTGFQVEQSEKIPDPFSVPILTRRGVVLSMSRKGNCYDNAPVESFFSSLKNELVRHRKFQTQAEAQAAIEDYIDRFYNRQRLHQALGYRSPEEFERQESGA